MVGWGSFVPAPQPASLPASQQARKKTAGATNLENRKNQNKIEADLYLRYTYLNS